jgi:XRE family transcriptional regulator, regulator of sulfur utilization
MLIGKRIKDLRKQKQMTLAELAKQSGIQIATLSRIENQKMVGTVDSHLKLAKALGVDFTEIYKDATYIREETNAETSPHPTETFTYNKNATYEMLSSNILSKKMMPILLRIEPNGRTNTEQNAPGSERFIFIIEGQITVHISQKEFKLSPANTLYFNAAEEHYFVNNGSTIARLISVITPVSL